MPSTSHRKSAPEQTGKLRIGDDWNAINIIALSQSNPLKAVAEFVENETIYHLVRAMGLTYAQGFYLGQPGPDLPRSLPPALCDTGYASRKRGPQPTNLV